MMRGAFGGMLPASIPNIFSPLQKKRKRKTKKRMTFTPMRRNWPAIVVT